MLYSIDSDKPIRGIPRARQEQFNMWRSNISDSDYNAIVDQINEYCDTHEVFISSFIPATIWGNEQCYPLLTACNQNQDHAGFFFGLIVWQVMIERPEDWIFMLADKDSDDILGTKYWRRDREN